jgi:hypothetical protein
MDFCFENNIVFAPVSATVDSLADPSLISLPAYRRLVQDILERKRRDCQILGTLESLEVLLMGKKYPCYAMISPHIYPNGDLFYPCQPLGRIAGNLLQFESTTAIYHEGERKFGKMGECRRGCALNCYVFSSFFIRHLWDQVAKESVIQFAFGSKALLPQRNRTV